MTMNPPNRPPTAPQVFKHMYCADPALHPLMAGMDNTACGAGALAAASLQGAFSLAALDALSGGGGGGATAGATAGMLPPAEELAAALVAESPLIMSPSYSSSSPDDATNGGASDASPPRPLASVGGQSDSSPLTGPHPPPSSNGNGNGSPPARPLERWGSHGGGSLAAAAQLARVGSMGGGSGWVTPATGGALARAGSGGLARAGSISAKKSSPNRVCCNALLASYARAAPAQWRRARALLEGMWACGGELTPDIVR
jgi:hypothetical protein